MTEPVLLGVNIDHIATVRQARGTRYPDVVHAAAVAEQAGADLITIHLREDRRHIQDRDVELLRELLGVRLNLEMAVTDEMLGIAERICPADVCLVPERREELTTEGGLDVVGGKERIREACARMAEAGIRVSLFVDPDPAQLTAAREVGAPVVELHTGAFAHHLPGEPADRELARIRDAAERGTELGLVINAGHGLHYHNVQRVAAIPAIRELNIGHAIVARALFSGLGQAVGDMKALMIQARK